MLSTSIGLAVTISLFSQSVFSVKPTVTSLQSQRHPVWDVDFPTVSMCSINRISKREARKFAAELYIHVDVSCYFRFNAFITISSFSTAKDSSLNLSGTIRHMRYFGRMYEFNDENFNELLDFQDILDRYDIDPTTGVFNVRQRMLRVLHFAFG